MRAHVAVLSVSRFPLCVAWISTVLDTPCPATPSSAQPIPSTDRNPLRLQKTRRRCFYQRSSRLCMVRERMAVMRLMRGHNLTLRRSQKLRPSEDGLRWQKHRFVYPLLWLHVMSHDVFPPFKLNVLSLRIHPRCTISMTTTKSTTANIPVTRMCKAGGAVAQGLQVCLLPRPWGTPRCRHCQLEPGS